MPGNRAHVDLLFQKFDEDANIDFDSLDIAVNAVATAVKDFFFKVGQKTATPHYNLLFCHVCDFTEEYGVV